MKKIILCIGTLVILLIGMSGCTDNDTPNEIDEVITNIYHTPENPTVGESVTIYATIKDNTDSYIGLIGYSIIDGETGGKFYTYAESVDGEEYTFSILLSSYDYNGDDMELRYKICILDYNPDTQSISYINDNTLFESEEYSITIS